MTQEPDTAKPYVERDRMTVIARGVSRHARQAAQARLEVAKTLGQIPDLPRSKRKPSTLMY